MRMMLKVTVPVERGSQMVADGSLQRKMQAILADLKPEAAYFSALGGKRTALIFLDLADAAQMPALAEPFFTGFEAEVEFHPVMTAEDLGRGLPAALDALRRYE